MKYRQEVLDLKSTFDLETLGLPPPDRSPGQTPPDTSSGQAVLCKVNKGNYF